jgi:hypothetical protein
MNEPNEDYRVEEEVAGVNQEVAVAVMVVNRQVLLIFSF